MFADLEGILNLCHRLVGSQSTMENAAFDCYMEGV